MTLNYYTGFHCNEKNTVKIAIASGIAYLSEGDTHWLGNGAYFFDESLKGLEHAENWGKNHKQEPEIIKAHIEVEPEKEIDLTNQDVMNLINELQELYIDELLKKAKYKIKHGQYIDGLFFNLWDTFMEDEPIDLIKKRESYPLLGIKKYLNSRVPNALVLCVRNRECIKNMEICKN